MLSMAAAIKFEFIFCILHDAVRPPAMIRTVPAGKRWLYMTEIVCDMCKIIMLYEHTHILRSYILFHLIS